MMRFLVDNSLSPRMAEELRSAGHDAIHVRDLALSTALDDAIFAAAAAQARVIIAQDTDFGTILAAGRASEPSVVLFRCRVKSAEALLPLLLGNLPNVSEDLQSGSVVVLEDTRVRIRRLPIGGHHTDR